MNGLSRAQDRARPGLRRECLRMTPDVKHVLIAIGTVTLIWLLVNFGVWLGSLVAAAWA